MRGILSFFIIVFVSSCACVQSKQEAEPLIIQGQITNTPEKYLAFEFRDKNHRAIHDTVQLDEKGNFHLRTFKVKYPQMATVRQDNIQINNFFVAPGYNLTITGNGKDHPELFKSKKISGIGSESNRYRFMLDSVIVSRRDKTEWYNLNGDDLQAYANKSQKLKDSIANIVFGSKPRHDKYFNHFGSLVRQEIQFDKLYMLLLHSNVNEYSYERSVSFIWDNVDNGILDDIYNEKYLHSPRYRSLIGYEWLNYLVLLDYIKDSTLKTEKDYHLRKVDQVYTGKVKEFVLYNIIDGSITFSKSLGHLNDYRDRFEPYVSQLDPISKEILTKKFAEKEAELLRTQVGKPAPFFTLESNTGKKHSLEDFKGRVVLLDLWASWCAPCRKEMPALRQLHEKYKNDDRIVFIGIGVHDGISQWKKALAEEKPQWLQLIDADKTVWKSYVANAIPKFVIIDKQGNIVDFDAPWPSDGKELEELLLREMAK